MRETRLFEMTQSVPWLIWVLLMAFGAVLVGFLLFAIVFAATGGKGLKRIAALDDHGLAPGAAIPAGDPVQPHV